MSGNAAAAGKAKEYSARGSSSGVPLRTAASQLKKAVASIAHAFLATRERPRLALAHEIITGRLKTFSKSSVRRSKDSPVNGTSAPVFRLMSDS